MLRLKVSLPPGQSPCYVKYSCRLFHRNKDLRKNEHSDMKPAGLYHFLENAREGEKKQSFFFLSCVLQFFITSFITFFHNFFQNKPKEILSNRNKEIYFGITFLIQLSQLRTNLLKECLEKHSINIYLAQY